VIVIDFENKDLRWVSGAFYSMLVGLHRRSFKATGVLKLCNVPETIMERFREYRFVDMFNIYPNLEAALKSDTLVSPLLLNLPLFACPGPFLPRSIRSLKPLIVEIR
jgi:hypothetical protein